MPLTTLQNKQYEAVSISYKQFIDFKLYIFKQQTI